MKKKLFLGISVLLCLICGCSSKNTEDTDVSEDKIVTLNISEKKYEMDYQPFETRVNEAENIVYGKVKEIEYTSVEGGIAWTKENFVVKDVLKGDLSIGDEIKVYEAKGYISVKDYIDKMSDGDKGLRDSLRAQYDRLSEDELSEKFIAQSDGTPFPQIGDRDVLFIVKSDPWTEKNGSTAYSLLAGWYGRYTQINNGELVWIQPDADADISTLRSNRIGNDYEEDGISLEKLKQNIKEIEH